MRFERAPLVRVESGARARDIESSLEARVVCMDDHVILSLVPREGEPRIVARWRLDPASAELLAVRLLRASEEVQPVDSSLQAVP